MTHSSILLVAMTTYFGETEVYLDRNVSSAARQPFHTTEHVDRHTLCCSGPSAVHNIYKYVCAFQVYQRLCEISSRNGA